MKKILYGAGHWGKIAFNYYGQDEIYAFADKNQFGKEYLGKQVLNPLDLKVYQDYEIVVCIKHYEPVTFFLESIGIDNYKIFYHKDIEYLTHDVPMSKIANHANFISYLSEIGNKKGMKILEIGSRVVTGSNFRSYFSNAEYIGFDIYEGENVDIVGDAHKLSKYFDSSMKFDIIFSHAVFEHLAMPWLLPIEISKLLNIGGIVFVETHFSFSSHERPWHFYQFSDMALRTLFNSSLGFECIEAGFSNPIAGRFSEFADDYLKNTPVNDLYCHCGYLGRKVNDVVDFDWNEVSLEDIVENTMYPISNS